RRRPDPTLASSKGPRITTPSSFALLANPRYESFNLPPFPVRCGIHKMVRVHLDALSVCKYRNEVAVYQEGLGETRAVERDAQSLNRRLDSKVCSVKGQRVRAGTERHAVRGEPAWPLHHVDGRKNQRLSQ